MTRKQMKALDRAKRKHYRAFGKKHTKAYAAKVAATDPCLNGMTAKRYRRMVCEMSETDSGCGIGVDVQKGTSD